MKWDDKYKLFTWDIVMSPAFSGASFSFPSDYWIDPRQIEIGYRKEKINKILRIRKIKFILKRNERII